MPRPYQSCEQLQMLVLEQKSATQNGEVGRYRAVATYFAYDANERRYFDGLAQ